MDEKLSVPYIELSVVNDNVHYCNFCDKTIKGGSYKFKCHLYRHRAIQPRFTCKTCFKEFYRNDNYERHLSKHTKKYKKTFICDYCNREFVDKRNLIHHLKIHDDSFIDHPKLKQYRCQACDVVYAEERCLKQHVRRMHLDLLENEPQFVKKPVHDTWFERVLDTNICVQLTKLNNNVLSIKKCGNVKTVDSNVRKVGKMQKYFKGDKDTSQYSKAVCDYCKKEMIKKSLRQHIKERHLKIRKFSCKMCERGFSRRYLYVNHTCRLTSRQVKLPSQTKGNNKDALKSTL